MAEVTSRNEEEFMRMLKGSVVDESRLKMFSGWLKNTEIQTPWGTAKLEGEGLSQDQADVLDFARAFAEHIGQDPAGNVVLIVRPPDFARLKGIDPGSISVLFHRNAKKLMHSSVEITKTDGRKKAFSICTLCQYDPEEYCPDKLDKPTPIPPHRVKKQTGDVLQVTGKKGIAPNNTSRYYIRLSAEFVKFYTSFISTDYSKLLKHILPLPDAPKRAARFFLGHQRFRCSTTQLLNYIYYYGEGDNTLASTKSNRKKSLLKHISILAEKFGIMYDAETDMWSYEQHGDVYITVSDKVKSSSKPGDGANV